MNLLAIGWDIITVSVISPVIIVSALWFFISIRSEDAKSYRLASSKLANQMNGKLDLIHTLVNSNMTAAMQAEYDATVRLLAMMKELVAVKEAVGHKPSAVATKAIADTEDRVQELRAALNDRKNQT